MTPTITTIASKKLVGKHLTMSLADIKTHELWKGFMPLRKTITNAVDNNRYSLQLYPDTYFKPFNPHAEFKKWAAVEVPGFESVPDGMETLELLGGLYAMFYYKGNPTNGDEVFRYIFMDWLPTSGYALDDRPHFEVLGSKYQNGSDDSEEEIWIPIKSKIG